jgi:hypothetical protein
MDFFSPAQIVGYAAFVLGMASFLQKTDRRLAAGDRLLPCNLRAVLQRHPTQVLFLSANALWLFNNVLSGLVGPTALKTAIFLTNGTTIVLMLSAARAARRGRMPEPSERPPSIDRSGIGAVFG